LPLTLRQANDDDAPELVRLHMYAGFRLTQQFGQGPWTGGMTVKGLQFEMGRSTVYAACEGGAILGTFALSTRKPWSIDASFFTKVRRPLYLTSMAVDPAHQRRGVGSFCISEARRLAQEWPADAIRLDAWDADAGAGGFYLKCGFRETGRNIYRNARLIYFEMLS
jgi:ribosomal protein S18 acetylase RimI-like enzyme